MTDTAARVCNVAPQLEPFLVPIATIGPDLDNANRGDVPAAMRSLERFGQRYPIVVRKPKGRRRKADPERRCVAGSTRWEAMTRLGWTHLAVVNADDLTADEARAFAIADNRTGRLGEFDDLTLAEQLEALDDDLREAASFTEPDIDELLARLLELDAGVDDSEPPDRDGAVGNVVTFKFGDIVGQVGLDVYQEFVNEYEARRDDMGFDAMLEDVLVSWLL